MFASLPHPVSSLILFFLVASPMLSIASPVPDLTVATPPTPVALVPRQNQPSTRLGRRAPKKVAPLEKKDYSSFLCPASAVACPVSEPDTPVSPESIAALSEGLNSLADWFTTGFECVDLATELNQCGGCLAFGEGQDCSTIPNARATGCEASSCAVYSCYDGYTVSPDRQTCVKKDTNPAAPQATPVAIGTPTEQVVLSDRSSSL